jgi:hypothetical protein
MQSLIFLGVQDFFKLESCTSYSVFFSLLSDKNGDLV